MMDGQQNASVNLEPNLVKIANFMEDGGWKRTSMPSESFTDGEKTIVFQHPTLNMLCCIAEKSVTDAEIKTGKAADNQTINPHNQSRLQEVIAWHHLLREKLHGDIEKSRKNTYGQFKRAMMGIVKAYNCFLPVNKINYDQTKKSLPFKDIDRSLVVFVEGLDHEMDEVRCISDAAINILVLARNNIRLLKSAELCSICNPKITELV